MMNWPNPFIEQNTVKYFLDEPSEVTLQIVNSTGQTVTSISDGFRLKGEHSYQWDSKGLPPGIYFILIKTEGKIGVSKAIKR